MIEGDASTKDGAERIARKIATYWTKRGRPVAVRCEPEDFTLEMRSAYWVVRSDMVGGLPPVKKGKRK